MQEAYLPPSLLSLPPSPLLSLPPSSLLSLPPSPLLSLPSSLLSLSPLLPPLPLSLPLPPKLMMSAMDVAKRRRAVREVVSNVEEEEEAVVREREQVEMSVLDKLTSPCLEEAEKALSNKL